MHPTRPRSFPALMLLLAGALPALVVPTARAQSPGQPRWDQGDPKAEEQFMLQYMNRARANPSEEGQRMAAWMREFPARLGYSSVLDGDGRGPDAVVQEMARYPAVPPLAYNPRLSIAARVQAAYQGSINRVTHTGPGGSAPFSRVMDAGYGLYNPAERDYDGRYFTEDVGGDFVLVRDTCLAFLVDYGNPGCGHRLVWLDAVPTGTHSSEVGPGWDASTFVALEFGSATETPVSGGAKVTGAAYVDRDGDGFYSLGEGLAGVVVTSDASSYYAVTSASGGYSLPVDLLRQQPGVARVTFRLPDGRGMSFSAPVTAATDTVGPTGAPVYQTYLDVNNAEVNLRLGPDGSLPAAPAAAVSVVGAARERGGFVVSRADGDTGAALAVACHVGGSGIAGVDYVAVPGKVKFAAGQGEVVIPVTLLPGANRNHKVKFFLDPSPKGAYGLGKAQSKVLLGDL